MKAIILHFGILMALLTIIYGLWQEFNYEYLIIKTIEVFFIWIFGTYFMQMIFKLIINIRTEGDDDNISMQDVKEENKEKYATVSENESK